LSRDLLPRVDFNQSVTSTFCIPSIPPQKRNKPKAPPTAPKAAPFFLTTTKELVPKFVVEEKEEETDEKMKSVR
jgi:hypothetical protein